MKRKEHTITIKLTARETNILVQSISREIERLKKLYGSENGYGMDELLQIKRKLMTLAKKYLKSFNHV